MADGGRANIQRCRKLVVWCAHLPIGFQPCLVGSIARFVVQQAVGFVLFAAADDLAVLSHLHCTDCFAQLLCKVLRRFALDEHLVEILPDFKAAVDVLPPQPGGDVCAHHRGGEDLFYKTFRDFREFEHPSGGNRKVILAVIVFFERDPLCGFLYNLLLFLI